MPRRAADVLGDSELNETLFSPVCAYCKYWKPLDGHHCLAWPKPSPNQQETPKIPQPIWDGQNYHVVPYGGEAKGTDGKPILFVPDRSVVRTRTNARLLDAYASAHQGEAAKGK